MGSKTPPSQAIPPAWATIASQSKTLLTWPSWSEPELPVPATKPARSRQDLNSIIAETTEVVLPLGDASKVGLVGVQLRLTAWAYRRMHEVTATLEVPGGRRSFVTIARLDAWPSSPHMNVTARKTSGLRHVPLLVEGSHVHQFSDNARLGLPAFLPPRNLPVAVPIEPLTSFRGMLRTVAQEFVIVGLEDFDPPPWQEYLL